MQFTRLKTKFNSNFSEKIYFRFRTQSVNFAKWRQIKKGETKSDKEKLIQRWGCAREKPGGKGKLKEKSKKERHKRREKDQR